MPLIAVNISILLTVLIYSDTHYVDWLFGMLDGHTGLFPRESVVPAAGPESRNFLVSGFM